MEGFFQALAAGPSDRRHLRPDVRRARPDLRRHARHQLRSGRFHDARHVCRLLSLHCRSACRPCSAATVGPFVGDRCWPGRCCSSFGYCVHQAPDLARPGTRTAALEGEGHYAQLILTLGIALILQNGGADRVRLGAGLDPHAAVELGLGDRAARATITRLPQQGAQHRRDRLAGRPSTLLTVADHAARGSASRCAPPPTIRTAATYMGIDVDRGASHRVRARHRHHGDRRRPARDLLSVPALCRPRIRDRHVCRRRARRHGQHHRRVLGRHDDRPGAAAFDAGPADAVAERGDLRGLPSDRLLPPAGFLRAHGGADLMRMRRDAFAAASSRLRRSLYRRDLAAVVKNRYYQLMLTLVPVWAVFGLSWNILQRLYRPDLVRARRLLRDRRLYDRRSGRSHFDLVALDRDPDRGGARRARGAADRLSDLPAARPLLRAGDARLPARAPLRLRVARLPGGDAADEARRADAYHAVQRSRASTRCSRWPCYAWHDRDHARDRAIAASAWRCSRSSRTSRRRRRPASTRCAGSCARSR